MNYNAKIQLLIVHRLHNNPVGHPERINREIILIKIWFDSSKDSTQYEQFNRKPKESYCPPEQESSKQQCRSFYKTIFFFIILSVTHLIIKINQQNIFLELLFVQSPIKIRINYTIPLITSKRSQVPIAQERKTILLFIQKKGSICALHNDH